MAKELLPGQELCAGRYEVVKTLSFGEPGGVYTLRDRESRQVLLLKEFIPPTSMTDEELALRVEQFNEALLILASFDHPNLCKIYLHFSEGRRQYVVMERVEGVTLKTLLDMSVKPLPEPQVLRWAMDLCDAMHYMHDRPKPFIFDVLDTTHIMMTTDEQLKLINFGLDRFFQEGEFRSFTASREQLATEMHSLGDTLVFLLTRKPPGPFGLTGDEGISEELSKLLLRLLNADPERTVTSFDELKKLFDRILNPPPPTVKVDRGPQKPWVRLWNLRRTWDDAFWAYLRQPLWLVASEILGLAALAVVAWFLLNPTVHPRQGPAAYVACGKEIYVVRADDKSVLTRVPLHQAVTSLVATPRGDKLFAAGPGFPNLYVLNTLSNRFVGVVPVDRGPQKLVMGPGGEYLYVLHTESGQVGFVRTSPEALPMEVTSQVFHPKDSMVAIFSAGPGVQGLAAPPPPSLAPGNPEPAVSPTAAAAEIPPATPAPSPSPSPSPSPEASSPRIYCSSQAGNRVTALETSPLKVLATVEVQAPGALALTPDGRQLLVAQTASSHILTFGAETLAPGPRIVQVGGTNIQQILASPDGKELWSVNGSGSLGVLGAQDHKLRGTVALNGSPSAACWRTAGTDPELWVALRNPNQVVVVNPSTRMIRVRIPIGGSPTDIWVVP